MNKKGQIGRGLAASVSLIVVFVLMILGNLAASASTITADRPGTVLSRSQNLRNVDYDFLFERSEFLGEKLSVFEALSLYSRPDLVQENYESSLKDHVSSLLRNESEIYFERESTCFVIYLSNNLSNEELLDSDKYLFFEIDEMKEVSFVSDFEEFRDYVRSDLLVALPNYEFTYKEEKVKSSVSYYYGPCKEF